MFALKLHYKKKDKGKLLERSVIQVDRGLTEEGVKTPVVSFSPIITLDCDH